MSLIPFDDRDGFIWYDGALIPWRDAKLHGDGIGITLNRTGCSPDDTAQGWTDRTATRFKRMAGLALSEDLFARSRITCFLRSRRRNEAKENPTHDQKRTHRLLQPR